MSSRLTNAMAASAVALVLPLTACTRDDVGAQAPIGQVERTETIDALNLVLVTEGEGVARLVGTLINNAEDPDRLIGVDVDTEVGASSVTLADGPVVLRADDPVRLARDAVVTIVSDGLRPGFRPELTLDFADSESIVTTVPVELKEGAYRDVEVNRPPDGDIRPGG